MYLCSSNAFAFLHRTARAPCDDLCGGARVIGSAITMTQPDLAGMWDPRGRRCAASRVRKTPTYTAPYSWAAIV